jgi:hypothetical protein
MSKERLIFHRRTRKTGKQQGHDDDDEDLAPILTANLPLPPIPQLDFDEGQHDLVEPVDLDLEVDPPIINKNLNLNPPTWGLLKVNKQMKNREIETIFKFFLSITEISECTKKSKKEERAETSSTKLYLYFM